MKKNYAAAAVALAIGLSASAADYQQYKGEANQALKSASEFTVAEKGDNGMHKAPAEAPGDGVNMYSWTYYTAYQTSDGQTFEEWRIESVEIEFRGNKAIINGFFDLASIEGDYNRAEGTITFSSQDLFYTMDGANLRLYTWNIVPSPSDPSKYMRQEGPIVLHYTPDGVQLTVTDTGEEIVRGVGGFSSETNVSMWVSHPTIVEKGSGWIFADMCFFADVPSSWPGNEQFVYNASEWKDCGVATLDEGWMAPILGGHFPEYEVKCMQNVNNPNRLLLVDPYGVGPYAELGLPANSGFIQLDVTNPDVVLVVPFTNSGLQFSDFDDVPDVNFFNMTNAEGMKIFVDGYTYDDIIEEAEYYGDELPTLKNGVITIPQCRIQTPGHLGSGDYWSAMYGGSLNDPKDPFDDDMMYATITIPALAGVDGIVSDTENAPKRYFNLQGIEVANPAAGEVVIVKEGDKAHKTIVR